MAKKKQETFDPLTDLAAVVAEAGLDATVADIEVSTEMVSFTLRTKNKRMRVGFKEDRAAIREALRQLGESGQLPLRANVVTLDSFRDNDPASVSHGYTVDDDEPETIPHDDAAEEPGDAPEPAVPLEPEAEVAPGYVEGVEDEADIQDTDELPPLEENAGERVWKPGGEVVASEADEDEPEAEDDAS